MQELKIREYHSQLELKKIELNYLKNQIRPHFYLNMLSMIHSMLQTKNYKEIEELTILTQIISVIYLWLIKIFQNLKMKFSILKIIRNTTNSIWK